MELDIVSKIAGHSDVLITTKTYGHVTDEDRKKGAVVIASLISQKNAI